MMESMTVSASASAEGAVTAGLRKRLFFQVIEGLREVNAHVTPSLMSENSGLQITVLRTNFPEDHQITYFHEDDPTLIFDLARDADAVLQEEILRVIHPVTLARELQQKCETESPGHWASMKPARAAYWGGFWDGSRGVPPQEDFIARVTRHAGFMPLFEYFRSKSEREEWDEDKERKLADFCAIIQFVRANRETSTFQADFRNFMRHRPSFSGWLKPHPEYRMFRDGVANLSNVQLSEALQVFDKVLRSPEDHYPAEELDSVREIITAFTDDRTYIFVEHDDASASDDSASAAAAGGAEAEVLTSNGNPSDGIELAPMRTAGR